MGGGLLYGKFALTDKHKHLIIILEDFMDRMFTERQDEDLKFFHDKLAGFLADPLYQLKYVVISNKQVAGVFDTFDAALVDAVSKFPPNEYIIKQVISAS
jgi:hypothetical protein